MAKRTYTATLNSKSINNLIKELTAYRDELQAKCNRFVQELANIGIQAAESNKSIEGRYGTHKMEDYVTFSVTVSENEAILIGVGQTFESIWTDSEGQTHTSIVKPLSMLEWGSGAFALPPQSRFGGEGGKGTMAVAGHENDTDWGRNDNWTAITPSMPMYHAWLAMESQINTVAKRVFGK